MNQKRSDTHLGYLVERIREGSWLLVYEGDDVILTKKREDGYSFLQGKQIGRKDDKNIYKLTKECLKIKNDGEKTESDQGFIYATYKGIRESEEDILKACVKSFIFWGCPHEKLIHAKAIQANGEEQDFTIMR